MILFLKWEIRGSVSLRLVPNFMHWRHCYDLVLSDLSSHILGPRCISKVLESARYMIGTQ